VPTGGQSQRVKGSYLKRPKCKPLVGNNLNIWELSCFGCWIMASLTTTSSSPHAISVSFEVIDAVQRTLEKEGK